MSARTSGTRPKQLDRSAGAISGAVLVPWIVLVAITVWGIDYYTSPLGERMRHDLHAVLRPSGDVGQTAGVLTFAGFLFLWLYPLRKRLGGGARWAGGVARWLEVHIVVGLTLPLLGAVHAAWRFDGIIGLGYWAMLTVAASGVIGRYVYARIPRDRSGLELGAEELAQQRRQLLLELTQVTGLEREVVESILAADPVPARGSNVVRTLSRMVQDDLLRRRAVATLSVRLKSLEHVEVDAQKLRTVAALARRQMALTQQARLLGETQRIFRHWHTLHRPVALTAFVAVTIHVVVVVWTGVTWFY
jgi:hypothetical protein